MKSKLIILLLAVVFNGASYFAQTFTNSANHNFTNGTVYTTTFNVSGVNAGDILRQVTLRFGDGSMYSGELTRAVITLTSPSGTVVTLLEPNSFNTSLSTTDSDRRYLNITLRDHAELNTPKGWADATGNFISHAYPFNYGYWRIPTPGAYSNYTGSHNGTWTLSISYPGLSTTYPRKYISSELVFGDDFEYVDIRTTQPNQSCDTKQCLETGKVYLGTNVGYPNGQPNIPLTLGGCQWNIVKNNSAWFYFTASSPTVELSISGFTRKIESIVAISSDCQNFTLANGGCPTTMYNSSPGFTQYFEQDYAAGYSQNHGYQLTGLTVGQEYILILDGMDGTPVTASDFYIEIESGADDGCCPVIDLTVSTTDSDCSGSTGTITVTPSGGAAPYTYDFGDGNGFVASNTVSGLAAGTYNVVIRDDNGCEEEELVIIATTSGPTIDNIDITGASCGDNNGAITVTASGGVGALTYSIDGGVNTQASGTFSNLPSGSITVSVFDDNCQIDSTFTIGTVGGIVPDQPSIITGDQTVCSGASGTYSVTNVPGVTYTWTYSGTGTITGTGNSISLDNITSGGILTVTPSNTCGDGPDQTITITVNDVPNQPSIITGDQTVCSGASGTYSVTNVPGVTYTWTYSGTGTITGTGNSISLDNITTGGILTVTPSNTCGNGPSQTIVITIGTGPTIDNIVEVDPSCGNTDGEITITVSGSTGTPMYSIDNGANFVTGNSFTGLGIGTYIVVVTDDTGCENTQTVELTNLNGPSIDDVVVTPTACVTADGTITITASGGTGALQYSIDNGVTFQGNGTFTGLGAGTYDIVVKDDNDCETSSTATIIQANAPSLALVDSQDITCNGSDNGSIVVEATGGTSPYTYNWTPNVSTTENASDLPAGNYTVTVTDDAGCSDNLQVTINEPTAMVVTEIITAATCGQQDGSIALQVTGGVGAYTYAWTPNVSTTATATGLGAGQYEVTVTDGNGCTQILSYTVDMESTFYAEIIPDNITINEGENIGLHLEIDPNIVVDEIIWSPSAGLSCTDCTDPIASPATTTTYYVQIISDDGCIANDSITITIKSPCAKLFVPTSFSPNGDGINDLACVMGDCILALELTIFNRWGEVVFQTDNQKECWDGTFRGKMVQSGVYVYKLNATLENNERIEESGNINVVR